MKRTFQPSTAPPCAEARLPRTHGDGRRPQGALGAARQGPQEPLRLIVATLVPPPAARATPRSRAYRLTGQGAFDAVFRAGRRVDGAYVQIIVAPTAAARGRTGYVIGRKVLARAVDRNRIRRKLREVVRAHRAALAAFDVIIRVKRAANRVGAGCRRRRGAAACCSGCAAPRMKTIFLALIRAYQYLLRPMLGSNCRFYPELFRLRARSDRDGTARCAACGSPSGASRRCHPYHPGGFDPVP